MKRWFLLALAMLILTGCAKEWVYEDTQATTMETASVPTAEMLAETTEAETTAPAEETAATEETVAKEVAVKEPAATTDNGLCKTCGLLPIEWTYERLCTPCLIAQLPPQVCERCQQSFQVVYIPTNGICPTCEQTPESFNCLSCGVPCVSFNEKHLCETCEAKFCYNCWVVMEEGHICEE